MYAPRFRNRSNVTEAPSSSGSAGLGRAHEASHTEDQDREVDEGLKRGGRAIDAVAEPAEAFELAEGALDNRALSLQRGLLGIQLTSGLFRRDAPPGRDAGSKPALLDKAAEAQAVVALVG
jgi:hypothetical protein